MTTENSPTAQELSEYNASWELSDREDFGQLSRASAGTTAPVLPAVEPIPAAPATEVKPATPEADAPAVPTWLVKSIDYIARINRDHKCSSAQSLFNKLSSLATNESNIIQKCTGHDRDKLFFVESCKAIGFVTFRKFLPEIKAHKLS